MSKEGAKELAAACRGGKLAEVERMLAAGMQEHINETTEVSEIICITSDSNHPITWGSVFAQFGGTAFVQACAAGEFVIAQRLILAGADIDATTAVSLGKVSLRYCILFSNFVCLLEITG
jgi:hypothetical protein